MSLSSIVCSLFFTISELWRTNLKFEESYMLEMVGRRKLSFFPLRDFCIQFLSLQAKQMGTLFHVTIFNCTIEVLWLKYFVLRIHFDWYEKTSKEVWIKDITVVDPIRLLKNAKTLHVLIGDLNLTYISFWLRAFVAKNEVQW